MIADRLIYDFVEKHKEETLELLKSLTDIPSPTGKEEWRADFCRAWLLSQGVEDVIQDQAGNIICPYKCSKNCDLLVVSAHLDTVFSEKENYEIKEKDGKLYAPGIGDDTANLVNMLMTIKFLHELDYEVSSSKGILFVANVGEEGLGNLKGSREIFSSYKERIREWISFDLYYNGIYDHAVGSHRYHVTVHTQGGHSYKDYGNKSAIAELSSMITQLYQQTIPKEAKSTLNVGRITGGTSVNSIAEEASMLYEFRSEKNECLLQMQTAFEGIVAGHQTKDVRVDVELLGIRPGYGEVDEIKEEQLRACVIAAIQKYYNGTIDILSASTDCNIPLSEGIPAVCFGTILGGALHTRNEWIDKNSLVTGQKIAIYSVLMTALL